MFFLRAHKYFYSCRPKGKKKSSIYVCTRYRLHPVTARFREPVVVRNCPAGGERERVLFSFDWRDFYDTAAAVAATGTKIRDKWRGGGTLTT